MRQSFNVTRSEAAHRKRTVTASILIFTIIPLTILLGLKSGDKHYLLTSMVLLVLCMLPFFMVFEHRRPKAREIVLIAMMSALTIVSQLLFYVTVPVQIGTAIVILSGVSLGPEAGFLIGALSRFVLNFYAGQGPWTPWQMFCWGLLGFLAGLCFNRSNLNEKNSSQFKAVFGPVMCIAFAVIAAFVTYLIHPGEDQTFWGWRLYSFGAAGLLAGVLLQRKRLTADSVTLTLFTFFTTFIVYGGLMNVCAMMTAVGYQGSEYISFDTLRALYVSGLPYDAAHAATAAVCIFLFGKLLIGKLERVKVKYGIYR